LDDHTLRRGEATAAQAAGTEVGSQLVLQERLLLVDHLLDLPTTLGAGHGVEQRIDGLEDFR